MNIHFGKFEICFRNHTGLLRKAMNPRYEIIFDNTDKYIGLFFAFWYFDLQLNKFK